MTSFQMAILHFKRQKLQSTLIVLSLTMALACSGLLLRLYSLSQSRYQNLPSDISSIVGPKSGGIEILLGALNAETKFHNVIPENLFQTLRAGADIKFEDGAIIPSKSITQSVIPISFIGKYKNYALIGTDESLFNGPAPNLDEAYVGSTVAKENNLTQGSTIEVEVQGTLSKKSQTKTLKISKVLEEKQNTWDQAVFVNITNSESWLQETEGIHPIWKNKTLNYILIKMNFQGFKPLQSLINDRTVSQLVWIETEKQKLEELTSSAKDFGLIIVAVILALAGFSIFGMMSIRAQTLRVSVATLEAIGYFPRYIYSWIFSEALLVGMIAASFAIIIESIGFQFISSSLGSTWLLPSAQSSTSEWAYFIFIEGIIFSTFGALLSIAQMRNLQIHSELKGG